MTFELYVLANEKTYNIKSHYNKESTVFHWSVCNYSPDFPGSQDIADKSLKVMLNTSNFNLINLCLPQICYKVLI